MSIGDTVTCTDNGLLAKLIEPVGQWYWRLRLIEANTTQVVHYKHLELANPAPRGNK